MSNRLVVFVCTGNICRSPMAEYLLKDQLDPDSDWEVCSAGVAAGYGMPASRQGIEVLREEDMDMTAHMSRPLDRQLLDMAGVIVVMAASHRSQILSQHPDAREKVFLLKTFDPTLRGGDVEDPLGASIEVYRAIRDEIAAALPGLIDFLKTLELPGTNNRGKR